LFLVTTKCQNKLQIKTKLKQFKERKFTEEMDNQLDYGLELSFLDSEGNDFIHSRSLVNQNENQAILRIEGVRDRADTNWYFGKRVVYVAKHGSKNFTTIWGRIATSHGNGGAVLARFAKNLPPKAIGSTLRVALFPQRHQ
jgi:large subunit ribosomal protein L35Ae